MKKIVNPNIINIQKELSSLALKVISNAHLNQAQLDNLFNCLEKEPNNDYLKNIKERLLKAQENKEKVFVFGDYDADGICATTLTVRLLNKLKLRNGYYIPNRLKEGYGLNLDILKMAIDKGYSLIITVDNGVSAYECLDYAKKHNIDVIIMDHHIIQNYYNYDYLLHYSIFEDYFNEMCGAGTVLQLIRYFKLDDHLDWILAMVATIGDMVPLFFINREIVKKGLKYLNHDHYLPIMIMSKKDYIDENVISYEIVPQINTLGRLSDRANANNLVKYFLLEDYNSIITMANQIAILNKERQNLIKESSSIRPTEIIETKNYIIYLSNQYHEGLIGLLANKFMNEYKKPVLVFTILENQYKGSGRSPNGFDIFTNISKYQDLFLAFGGHQQACGLTIDSINFSTFISKLKNEEKIDYQEVADEIIEININELKLNNVCELFELAPFGEQFKLPNFYIQKIKINKDILLKNNYHKLVSFVDNEEIDILVFKEEYLKHLHGNALNDVEVSLSINEYNNKKTVNLIVNDII